MDGEEEEEPKKHKLPDENEAAQPAREKRKILNFGHVWFHFYSPSKQEFFVSHPREGEKKPKTQRSREEL
jgi:hypothetical protein